MLRALLLSCGICAALAASSNIFLEEKFRKPSSHHGHKDASSKSNRSNSIDVEQNITYLRLNTSVPGSFREELADLYRPNSSLALNKTLLPAMILIHGGGFTKGDKADAREDQIAHLLANEGYFVMSINYMLGKIKKGT